MKKIFEFLKRDIFMFLSVIGISIHIGTLIYGINTISYYFFTVMAACVILLLLLNVIKSRFENMLRRRLARENDYVLQKNQSESAVTLAQKNLEREHRIYNIHHDINNHLSVVLSMIDDNSIDAAKEYIEKIKLNLDNEALE